MLGDLKVVEDKLYQPEALSAFLDVFSFLSRNIRCTKPSNS